MLRDFIKRSRMDSEKRRPNLSRIKTGVNERNPQETAGTGVTAGLGIKNGSGTKAGLGIKTGFEAKAGLENNVASGTQPGTAGSQILRHPEVPDDCYRKCNFCGKPILNLDVRKNLYRCPKCGGYFRVHAYRRIEMIADAGSFCEFDKQMPVVDPLAFPNYRKKISEMQEKTGLDEAVVCGSCKIAGQKAVLCVCDGRFIMSSMGHNVGEKLTRAIETATAEGLPVIIYCCSGGARMQEGIISLMQMAKTAAALRRHHDAGLLYISVLTNPTTGGVTASFAMLGDIILAEPKALIGFAGQRVIEQTIRQKLPEGFQRAEFLLEHGFVDLIAAREEQKELLAQLIRQHDKKQIKKALSSFCVKTAAALDSEALKAENAIESGVSKIIESEMKENAEQEMKEDAGQEMKKDEAPRPEKTAWERVQLSRRADRPRALDYIAGLFEQFTELHGDRAFGDDGAIVGGIAEFCGLPVTVIAEQKGGNTKENLKRRFGMPVPEGYRKALRLMKEAEAFERPVICFVDTPGAYPGIESEERGQGEAIARCLYELSGLRVPVISIVLSEGGSGGALALAAADRVLMLENAVYSILSPEGFASILYKDAERAQEASEVMKLTAADLLKLGVIEEIVPEASPASKETLPKLCSELRDALSAFFRNAAGESAEERLEKRYQRFRRF